MNSSALTNRSPVLWLLGTVAVIAAAVAVVTGATRSSASPIAAQPAPALTVTAAYPRRVSWSVSLEAPGSIAPWQEASVGAQVSGYRLNEIRVNVGDAVKRGQVLARFDADMLHAEESQLNATLVQAEAAAAQAEANRARVLKLQGSGVISEQDVLQNVTTANTANAQVALVKAQLASKALQLRYTEVVAPDDGTISARSATLGAVASNGQELFRLIRQNRLEWRGEVTASQLAVVVAGQRIEIALPDGTSASARVRETAPSLDAQSRLGIVYAEIAPGSSARAGMYVTGRVAVSQAPALVVPAASVVIRDGRSYVMKLMNDGTPAKVALQEVSVGRRQGSDSEIVRGLTGGERLVVQGAGFLNDGDEVRVAASAAATRLPAAAGSG